MGIFRRRKKKSDDQGSLFPGKRLNIDEIISLENSTASIIELSYGISNKISRAGFESLSRPERVLHHVYWLETEVNNGGLNQYFFNSSGDYALDTPAALEEIGAQHTAQIVRDAISIFPGGEPPRTRDDRDGRYDLVTEEVNSRWDELDSMFFEYKDPLGDLQIEYMKSNKDEINL